MQLIFKKGEEKKRLRHYFEENFLVFFFFFFLLPFLGPLPQHMEVPRLGVELELQLPA